MAIAPGYLFRAEAHGMLEAFGRGVPREKFIVSPVGAFLVEHPEGPILIDTGMHPICATQPKRNLGAVSAAVFKSFKMGPRENVPAQLRDRGIEPDDVRIVLRLVSTPGHSDGHISVLVATERGPVFVLGDAVYTLRNLREDLLPWRTADDDMSRRTMAELREYAAAHPTVPLIPTHDPHVWNELTAS